MTIENTRASGLGMRHVQSILLFLECVVIFNDRLNVGVSLVAMTKAATTNPNFPEFDWSEQQIGYIKSSFYWSYVFTQFPGGILGRRYGTKLVLGVATFLTALLSAVRPWCVTWGGWQAYCVLRFLQGFFEGMIFCNVFAHLAKWSPKQERNLLGTLSLSGFDLGGVLAMSISGVIAAGPMGWPGIAYVSAGICFIWCILWFVLGANNPSESRFISETERVYIESSLAHEDDFHKKRIPIPYKAICTSIPFLMAVIARCSEFWGMTTLGAQIPPYFNGVLNLDIKSNAIFASLPFLASWIMSYVFFLLANMLQRWNVVTLSFQRKFFNTIAFWTPAVGLVAIGFLDEKNTNLALVLMTISVGVNSGHIIGSTLNLIDLSPNHGGILYSIATTVSNIMPLISPLLVGVIVTDSNNRHQWQIIFAIAATIYFVGNLLYIVFGTTEIQPWDAEDFLLSKDMENSMDRISDTEIIEPAINETIDSKMNETD